MDFLKLAQTRYSTRCFQDVPVEAEKVDRILQAALAAPTAKNRQPWRVLVLESAEALEKIRSCSPCLYGAPLVFLVCYNMSEQAMMDVNLINLGLVDASIVTTHMILEATDLGLGSCWVADFNADHVSDLFSLPDDWDPAALIPVGYSDVETSDRHDQRRDPAELILRK